MDRSKPRREHLLDAPFFFMVLKPMLNCLSPLLSAIYHVRWCLSRPFQVRVVPKWLPPIPGFRQIFFITFGEVILALPLVLIGLAGWRSFVDHGLDKSGTIAGYAILAAFLTANKSNSLLSLLLGIPFERLIPYHNLSSLLAIVLSAFHTYVAYVYGSSSDSGDSEESEEGRRLSSDSDYTLNGLDPNFLKFAFDGWTNLSGSMILICMLVLYSTSLISLLRRWLFEFWLVTHVISAMGVILFCTVHSFGEIWFVGAWWAIDVLIRYLVMANYKYPTMASLKLVLPDIVEVRFAKSSTFCYNAGQYVQISFPSISPFEFHPITISSSPHEPDVTLHIRALGSTNTWSRKLASLAAKQKEAEIRLEGPYGCVAVDLDDDDRYQMMLMVGGGIGVTPCQSLAKSVLHQHAQGRKLQKLNFVWAVRDLNMPLAYPPPIAQDTNAESGGKNSVLCTDIYLTVPVKTDEESTLKLPEQPFELHQGRPNFAKIFPELKREAKERNLTRIAVVACGPTAMMEEVRIACRQYSDVALKCTSEVKFDLHEELFYF